MSYLSAIDDNSQPGDFLIIIRPRIRVQTWTNVSGNIWSATFTHGYINDLYYGNPSLLNISFVLSTTPTTPTSGQYGYVHDTQTVYIYFPSDPNFEYIIARYDVAVSSKPTTWYRNPLDDTSYEVDFEPCVLKFPVFNQSNTDILFGYSPIKSSSINLANHDGFFNKHIYDGTFRNAPIKIYHSPRERPKIGFIREIFSGYVNNFSIDAEELSLTLYDSFLKFDNSTTFNAFTVSEFPNLDYAARQGTVWYKREVYGMLDGFLPVNIDYDPTPSVTNNRIWVTNWGPGPGEEGTLNLVIDHTQANTSTVTYTTTTPQLNSGDWVRITHSASSDYSVKVIAVDYTNKYFTHSSITRTVTAGDTVDRYFVGAVTIIDQDNVKYELQPDVHYTTGSIGLGNWGFTLADDFEAAIGFTNTPFDPSQHKLTCRIYGTTQPVNYTVGGGPVCSTTDYGGIISNAAEILYRIFLGAGLYGYEIDENSIQDAVSVAPDIGIAIPFTRDGQPPTFKEIITKIQQSTLWRVHNNNFNDYSSVGVSIPGKMTLIDHVIDNIDFSGIQYEHDYNDLYSYTYVNYSILEEANDIAPIGLNFTAIGTSNNALYINFMSKVFEMDSLLYVTTQAQALADKLATIVGYRVGKFTLNLPARFIDMQIGDNVTIKRESMPGFEVVAGLEQEVNAKIIEINKTISGVTLVLDDQLGIEESSGVW
mgnify:CR=1 FL=1